MLFFQCNQLETINIPGSVTSIADYAFKKCSSLTNVNFVEGSQLTSIGYMAFYWCNSLKTIDIPNSVNSIGEHAFNDCVKLTNVNFTDDSKINNVGNYAFADCPLTSIKFTDNDTYKRVSTKSKDGEEIGAYVIAKGQDLSTSVIAGCLVYGKINIELPDGKTSIVGNAFNGCIALTSVNIPSSIKNIGFKAFWHCKSLHEVTMNWNTQQLDWLELYKDSSILGDDGNIVNVYIPKGLIDQYKNVYTDSIISNGVTVKWYDSIRKSNLGLIIGVGIAIFTLISESCFGGYIYYKHYKNKKR